MHKCAKNQKYETKQTILLVMTVHSLPLREFLWHFSWNAYKGLGYFINTYYYV